MRIILTGGGTAGHVNPAIAIAEIIKSNISGAEILYVGTPNGMERRLIGEVGYPYYPIHSMGFTRTLSLKNLKALWIAVSAPKKAKKLLKLQVDLGYEQRQIVSGIAKFYTPDALVGKKVIIVANLKPAKLCGVDSYGMLLASGEENVKVVFVDDEAALGDRVH